MAKGKTNHTIAKVAAALRAADGIVPRAAEALGLARQNVHERIARSPQLQAVMAEIDDDMKDHAEGAIAKALKAGDMATVRWYAERKMRDKYGARIEIGLDTAGLEGLAAAIAKGGADAIRLAKAAIAAGQFP